MITFQVIGNQQAKVLLNGQATNWMVNKGRDNGFYQVWYYDKGVYNPTRIWSTDKTEITEELKEIAGKKGYRTKYSKYYAA